MSAAVSPDARDQFSPAPGPQRLIRMLGVALREVPDRVVLVNAAGFVIWVNPAFERRMGFTSAELVGRSVNDLIAAANAELHAHMLGWLRDGGVFQGDFLGQTREGIDFCERGTVAPITEAGVIVGFVYTATDTLELLQLQDELQQLQDELERLKTVDRVTGLANRQGFLEASAGLTDRSPSGNFAVILLEVDRLATVTDSLGFAAGDQILRRVSRRVALHCQAAVVSARVTEHGFALLIDGADAVVASALAVSLLDAVARPLEVGGVRLYVHGHAGVACSPEHGAAGEELLARASVAAHQSRHRLDTVVVFEPTMLGGALAEADVHEALARSQFFLRYQPIVPLRGPAVPFVEALARWRHPARGILSPGEFLPLIHESGLLVRFDRYVLACVCHQARAWRDQGLSVRVGVNVSAQSCAEPNLVDSVASELAAHDLPSDAIVIEMTETTAMSDPVLVAGRVAELRRLGVRVAIDDFGTGYSSLAYLKNFEVHELKIDRSFVTGLGLSRRTEALVRTMISLAKSLGLTTVAEGVETELQRDWLIDAGCDSMQGWLVSRALDVEVVVPFWSGREQR